MDTIVVHGEYTKDSYIRLTKFRQEAKKREWEISELTDDNSFTRCITPSLYGYHKMVIIGDQKSLSAAEFKYLNQNKNNIDATLIVYHKGLIPQNIIKKYPNIKKVEVYNPPKLIYAFLEGIYPGNNKGCLQLLYKNLENEPLELIFHLLCGHMKDLYWVKVEPSNISYASWKVDKLESQAKKFSLNQLKTLINKLSEIDVETKTSKVDLLTSLDLLLSMHLE